MGNTTSQQWLRSLDEIEQAIGACLATLDHREARISELFRDGGRSNRDVTRLLDSLSHVTGWTERLSAVQSYAVHVESLVSEVKPDWDRWSQALTTWQRLVEQLPTSRADSEAVFRAIADVTNRGHHPSGG